MSLKTFCQIPALSWAISNSVFQPVKFTSTLQKLLATFFQIFDIWRSSLDIMDDFKLIFRMVFYHFGEINTSLFLLFFKLLITFLIIKNVSEKNQFHFLKIFFWYIFYNQTEKDHSGNELKMIHYVQTWPPDVKNLNWICRPTFVTY